MFWFVTAAANLVVGALVGLTGVAGFLLPIVYTGPLGLGVTEGLALSFAAFIISGVLGSWNYKKAGKRKDKPAGEEGGAKSWVISDHLICTLILGFLTGAVCALSGAGGPVLVMPLLVVLGIPIRTAVGVALFNSIFIGVPACIGYLRQCSVTKLASVLAVALIFHGVGVAFGSKNAVRINQTLLKKGIAVFSILVAIWKLFL